jgi:isocitrate dehydrogenase kinase/phosphatase
MFPQRLDSPQAYGIAKAMMDGFNRHYRLFRTESARSKHRFETADWHGQQRAQRERIEFYDLRVKECTMRLEKEFKADSLPMDVWHQVKLHYIGLLVNHHQPELAETFFNSVTCRILHRTHFHNDFIFVRPAVSTEYIENEEPEARPTYRSYYPSRENLFETMLTVVDHFQLQREFEDLHRDVRHVLAAIQGRLDKARLRANFQIQVLSSLFIRNKGAYVVGKIINGFHEVPFAFPILHNDAGQLYIDAALFGEDDLQMLFSFARAYFMVDMEIPSAYVQFLRSLMPASPAPSCTTRWVWPSRARRCSTATFSTTSSIPATSFASPPASRAWSCWCSTCPAFRLCSSSSRTTTRRRKRRRVSRSRASTCSSSSTIVWGAWPTRWSTAKSPSRVCASTMR